jgi:hypothetical protein
MAEAELGPHELDLLEDALEELELPGALDRWSEDELDPRVRERLASYRSILTATREALPLEDVPTGVLDGVLAQARQAAAVAPVTVDAGRASWWSRLRHGFMVPVLALAGTAALVLWVFDPYAQGELEPLAPAGTAADAKVVARLEQAEPERAQVEHRQEKATPAASPAEGAKDVAGEVSNADEELAAEAPVDAAKGPALEPTVPGASDDDKPRLGSLGDAPNAALGGAAGTAPAQQKAGGSAGPAAGRWDIVSRGDRARQSGDCVAARDEYAVALEDDEPRVRARAFAGLGLCDAAAGDEASADANYERARALDDAIGGFIDSQKERSRGAEKKSRKPKKSKVAIDAFDDPADPFQ